VVTKDEVTDAVSALEAAERWERMVDVVRFVAKRLESCKLNTETLESGMRYVKTSTTKFSSRKRGRW
jgi:hypothetical protein